MYYKPAVEGEATNQQTSSLWVTRGRLRNRRVPEGYTK